MLDKKNINKKGRTRFGIDWEKREFGPHREKDGERAGKRKRGRFWNKRKVEEKRRRWRYMSIRVWWGKNKRKKRKKNIKIKNDKCYYNIFTINFK